MPQQRPQSGGRVSVEQEWRTAGKKNPARQPGIISKWGGIATRLILAPDVSIVQMVGVENPARWPGYLSKLFVYFGQGGFIGVFFIKKF